MRAPGCDDALEFARPRRCRRWAGCVTLTPVTDGSRKAILAALFANLGIAIAKFVGFIITGSAGMLAEAVHSLADTANQGFLLIGMRRSSRSAPSTTRGRSGSPPS